MDGYDAYAEERDVRQWAEDNARRRTAVKAWGCSAEAQGRPRCGGWCESETCPVDAGVLEAGSQVNDAHPPMDSEPTK